MISMHMNNFGTSDLSMRIALQGQDDYFWSVNPVLVPAQSGWVIAKFSVLPEDLKTGAGGGDVSATLSNVVALRIFRRVDGNDFRADPITTQLGIDDITAAEDPLPAEFIAFNAVVQGGSVNLLWRTASEINN